MRIVQAFIAVAVAMACLTTSPVAAADNQSYGATRLSLTVKGKTLAVRSVAGGEILRQGNRSTYSPVEIDMPADAFLAIVPEVDEMFAGQTFYRRMSITVTGFNGQAQRRFDLTSRQLTVTFPALDAASRDYSRVHLTLQPVDIDEVTLSTEAEPATSAKISGIDEVPAGDTAVEVGPDGRFNVFSQGVKMKSLPANFSVLADSAPSQRMRQVSAITIVVDDTDPSTESTTGRNPKVHVADPIGFKVSPGAGNDKDILPEWAAQRLKSPGTPGAEALPLQIRFLATDKLSTLMTLHFASAKPVRAGLGLDGVSNSESVKLNGFSLEGRGPRLTLGDASPAPGKDTPAGDTTTFADTTKTPVDPSAIQPASATAVMGQTYYVDGERNLAITLTGVRYSAERYAYGATESVSSEIVPGQGQKLLVATFDVTNTGTEEQRLQYHYFEATARDAKGGIRRSEGSYRADDRSEDEIAILPGETISVETVNIMAATLPVQELRIANASGVNIYNLKTAPITTLPAHLSANGIGFEDKVSAVPGQWYPAGVVDINLADMRASRDKVDGEDPGENYEYLLTTWQIRNGARGQRSLPGQTFVRVYDAGGQSWYNGQALSEDLVSTQPGFAAAGQDGDKQTVVFAVYIPRDTKVARVEFVEGGNHTFVYKP